MTEETWLRPEGTEETRQDADGGSEPADPDPETLDGSRVDAVRTGVPRVDAVLDEVDRLDDLPLDEHVTAFERAHESLRSALDADPDDSA